MSKKKKFRYKTHYKVMAWLSGFVMALLICVMYVGVYLGHWVTFDIGVFGSICACIYTVYNVIRYDKTKKLEISYAEDSEEIYGEDESEDNYEDNDEEEYAYD